MTSVEEEEEERKDVGKSSFVKDYPEWIDEEEANCLLIVSLWLPSLSLSLPPSLNNHQLMEVHLFLPFNPQFDA